MSSLNEKNTDKNEKTAKRTITPRQIAAMAGVILLVLLYVITLAVSIVDSSASGNLVWMCLFATVAIPILIWVYTWLYGRLTGKKTLTGSDSDTEKE